MEKKQFFSLAHVMMDLWNETDCGYWSVSDGVVTQFVDWHGCGYFEQLLSSNNVPFPSGKIGTVSEAEDGRYYTWYL